VIFHDYYSDVPPDEVDRLVQSQELARLITVGDDGIPHVGLYPFVYDGKRWICTSSGRTSRSRT
jgi:Pyridoxamine 5'-phosphate oxidase